MDHQHHFRSEIAPHAPITHVRFNIHPDGGVSLAAAARQTGVSGDVIALTVEPLTREGFARSVK